MDTNVRRWLVAAVGALLALDLVGGLIAVATDVNTLGEAWSAKARLAAPWPMIVFQILMTLLAVRAPRRVAIGAAGLLSAASFISAISGFFDGALAASELRPLHVVFQVALIAWTATVSVLAAIHAYRLVSAGGDQRETTDVAVP